MVRVIRFVALASCAVLLTGCSNSSKPPVASTKSMVDVSAAHSQANLKVLADTPLRPALIQIGEAFRRDSSQQVDFVFDASPVILKKLADGEAADVLIAQPNHIADLIKSGTIVPGEYREIGRVGLGLAVRADAPAQSVATVEELRQVLLKADTLVTTTVVSGNQFVAILERLMPKSSRRGSFACLLGPGSTIESSKARAMTLAPAR